MLFDSQGRPMRTPALREIAGQLDSSGRWQDLVADWAGDLVSLQDEILRLEGGGSYLAFDLYDRVLQDDQVFACLEQRFGIDRRMEVVAGGKRAKDKAAAARFQEEWNHLPWTEIVGQMKYAFLYGKSIGELIWEGGKDGLRIAEIRVRDRRRFRFDKDRHLRLITLGDQVRGIDLTEKYPANFWVFRWGNSHHEQPDGIGLGHWLYWPVTFKRQGVRFWMFCLQRAGTNLPIAYYPQGTPDSEKAKLKSVLQKLQQSQALVLPDGTRVDFPATNGGVDAYEKLVQWADEAITKIILTNTMTVEDGSSRSQAEVHERAAVSLQDSDDDLLCESFNTSVLRWWTWFNYGRAGNDVAPPQIWRAAGGKDPTAQLEVDKKLFDLGFPPTPEHIRDSYGDGYQTELAGRQINDGQVASLLQILTAAGRGDLPAATTRTLLRVACPALTDQQIDDMVAPLERGEKAKEESSAPPNLGGLLGLTGDSPEEATDIENQGIGEQNDEASDL